MPYWMTAIYEWFYWLVVRTLRLNTVRQYAHGAMAVAVDGQLLYVRYNTGDRVWFDEHEQPRTIFTHDDVYSTAGVNGIFQVGSNQTVVELSNDHLVEDA